MTTWQATPSSSPQPLQSLRMGSTAVNVSQGSVNRSPAFVSMLGPYGRHVMAGWRWLEGKRTQQLAARRLRVTETISLGEKRFVSILQVDGAQFLIGGGAGNVSLLAVLNKAEGSTTEVSQ